MSSSRRPWYPWYPKDFIVDEKVQGLSAHAELVYRRALDVMWQANDCQLPSNCLKLANALAKGLSQQEFENAWSEIQSEGFELFQTTPCGAWIYSKRLKIEAEKIENIQKTRSELGKKGAQAKAKANGKQLLKQKHKQSSSHTDTDTYIKKAKAFLSDSIEIKISQHLFDLILENNPNAKKPDLQKWAKHIDLAIRVDKRKPDDLLSVIDWCQKDKFWKSNILSTSKLRDQFDALWVKMTGGKSKNNKNLFASDNFPY